MSTNEPESDNVDQIIREALDQKNAEELADYSSDPTLFQLVAATFKGRLRWIVYTTFILRIVCLVGAISFTVQFFQTEDLKDAMAWGGGAMICFLSMVFLKMWYWQEMGRCSILREVKVLKWQVAKLSESK